MILDTNGVSAFFDGLPAVVKRVADEPGVLLPVIVIGEYRYGLLSSRERVEREVRFKGFCRACRLLSVDEETAGHYAGVRHRLRLAGTPIPENDIWIAALCLQHGQKILSNDRHFDVVQGVTRVGGSVLQWFSEAARRWEPEAVQRTEPKAAAADEIGRFSDQLIPKTKSKMAPRQTA